MEDPGNKKIELLSVEQDLLSLAKQKQEVDRALKELEARLYQSETSFLEKYGSVANMLEDDFADKKHPVNSKNRIFSSSLLIPSSRQSKEGTHPRTSPMSPLQPDHSFKKTPKKIRIRTRISSLDIDN